MEFYKNLEDLLLDKFLSEKNILIEKEEFSIPGTRAKSFIEREPYLFYLLRQLIREIERTLPQAKTKIQKRELLRLRIHEKVLRWIRNFIITRHELENFNQKELRLLALIFMLYYLEALSLLVSATAKLGKKVKGLIDFGKELFSPRLTFFEFKENFSSIDDLYDYCEKIAKELFLLLENEINWKLYLMEKDNLDLRLFVESKVLLEQEEREEEPALEETPAEAFLGGEELGEVPRLPATEPTPTDLGGFSFLETPLAGLEKEEEDIMAYAEKKAREVKKLSDVVEMYSLIFDKIRIEINYYYQVFSKLAQILSGEKFYYALLLKRMLDEFNEYLKEVEENYENFNSLPEDDKRMIKSIFKIVKTIKEIIKVKLLKESINIYAGYNLLKEKRWLSYTDWSELRLEESPEITKIIEDLKKTEKNKVIDLLIRTFNMENPKIKFTEFDKKLFSFPFVGSNIRGFLDLKINSFKDIYRIIDKVVGDISKARVMKVAFTLSKLNVISKRYLIDIGVYINLSYLRELLFGKLRLGKELSLIVSAKSIRDKKDIEKKVNELISILRKNIDKFSLTLKSENKEVFIGEIEAGLLGIIEGERAELKKDIRIFLMYDYFISFVLFLIRRLEAGALLYSPEEEEVFRLYIHKDVLARLNSIISAYFDKLKKEKNFEKVCAPEKIGLSNFFDFMNDIKEKNYPIALEPYCDAIEKHNIMNIFENAKTDENIDNALNRLIECFWMVDPKKVKEVEATKSDLDKQRKLGAYRNLIENGIFLTLYARCPELEKYLRRVRKFGLYVLLLEKGYSPFPNLMFLALNPQYALEILEKFKKIVENYNKNQESVDKITVEKAFEDLEKLVKLGTFNIKGYIEKVEKEVSYDIEKIEKGIKEVLGHKLTVEVINKLFKKEKDEIVLNALYWFEKEQALEFIKTGAPVGMAKEKEKELGLLGKMIKNALENFGLLSATVLAGPYLAVWGGITKYKIDDMVEELSSRILAKLGYEGKWGRWR